MILTSNNIMISIPPSGSDASDPKTHMLVSGKGMKVPWDVPEG
jgi:hypothetical protein